MTGRGSTRSGVKGGLTPNRSRPVVENDAYAAFAGRVIRAAGRRIGAGDVDGLAELAALASDVEESIGHAVSGLRRAGYSWAEIATRLGVTRQAAHQRWATTPTKAVGSMVGEVA